MTTLAPTLTVFDERVLAAVPVGRGVRVRRIVDDVQRHYLRYASYAAPSRDEIVGVLRGLEHLGLISQRNGWWRR